MNKSWEKNLLHVTKSSTDCKFNMCLEKNYFFCTKIIRQDRTCGNLVDLKVIKDLPNCDTSYLSHYPWICQYVCRFVLQFYTLFFSMFQGVFRRPCVVFSAFSESSWWHLIWGQFCRWREQYCDWWRVRSGFAWSGPYPQSSERSPHSLYRVSFPVSLCDVYCLQYSGAGYDDLLYQSSGLGMS